MNKKISLILIILTLVFFISMIYKNLELRKSLEPVKFLVEGENIKYDVQLKINGVTIGDGYVGDLKIFNKYHPLKSQVDELPSNIKKKMAFILKEGENNIELKFKQSSRFLKNSTTNEIFSFALVRPRHKKPYYYFSSTQDSGSVTSKFHVFNKNEEPKNYPASVGNANASFILSQRVKYFQIFLNNERLMSFGDSGGITDLHLIDGSNTLEIKYRSEYEGEFIYYIHTPNLIKTVTKTISKDQLNEVIIDRYIFKR